MTWQSDFSLSKTSTLCLGPSQPFVYWVLGVLAVWVKWLE